MMYKGVELDPSLAIIRPYHIELIPVLFIFTKLVQHHPGTACGLLLLIPGLIDRKLLLEKALHECERIVTLITRVYLSVQHDIRQHAG